MVKKAGETEVLRCSFCNKDQNDVRKLIAGPTVFICDECVEVCNDIIADDNRFENRGVRSSLPSPPEIKKFLDEYVIGQDRTKKKLAVAVYHHYKRSEIQKQPRRRNDVELNQSNIMPLGPTGTRKTLIPQTQAQPPPVPLPIVHAAQRTTTARLDESQPNRTPPVPPAAGGRAPPAGGGGTGGRTSGSSAEMPGARSSRPARKTPGESAAAAAMCRNAPRILMSSRPPDMNSNAVAPLMIMPTAATAIIVRPAAGSGSRSR